jgi:hypothetical protein
MACDVDTYRRLQISSTTTPPSSASRQLDYLMEVKGPLLECDLLAISSSALCLYRNNGSVEYYVIGDGEMSTEVDEVDDAEAIPIDQVDQIVKDAKAIMKKVSPDENFDMEDDVPEASPSGREIAKGDRLSVSSSSKRSRKPKKIIELEFEDLEGTPIDSSVPELMEDDVVIDDDENVDEERDGDGDEEDDGDVEEGDDIDEGDDEEVNENEPTTMTVKPPQPTKPKPRRDNPLPPKLEDADLNLGIIYNCIDLSVFYKKAPSLEADIIAVYDALDDNEGDMREGKISKIVDLSEELIKRARSELERRKKEELGLKSQLIKLSAVLDRSNGLKSKVGAAPAKFANVKPEVDRVYNQTKLALHEINVELLRVRDAADEMLESYISSLEEMVSQ